MKAIELKQVTWYGKPDGVDAPAESDTVFVLPSKIQFFYHSGGKGHETKVSLVSGAVLQTKTSSEEIVQQLKDVD